MGTWGTGIFQSDYALDVKDTYMDRIRKGEDDESVMNSLIAEYSTMMIRDTYSGWH